MKQYFDKDVRWQDTDHGPEPYVANIQREAEKIQYLCPPLKKNVRKSTPR